MRFHTIPFQLLMSMFVLCIGMNLGCSDNTEQEPDAEKHQPWGNKNAEAEESFFPVTAFLNGEIREMWELGSKVSLTIPKKGKLKQQLLSDDTLSWKESFKDFFSPTIDSNRLAGTYRLSKFMDETIHAITLSYERKTPIIAFPEWNNWNVYIEPETGMVKKLFLVKKIDSTHLQQLTWKHGKNCLIRDFNLDSTGNLVLYKEQEYIWK